jgi:hypothetical protein
LGASALVALGIQPERGADAGQPIGDGGEARI